MKRLLLLLLLVGTGCNQQRYHFMQAGEGLYIYRCDTYTGKVEIGGLNQPWTELPKPKP